MIITSTEVAKHLWNAASALRGAIKPAETMVDRKGGPLTQTGGENAAKGLKDISLLADQVLFEKTSGYVRENY